ASLGFDNNLDVSGTIGDIEVSADGGSAYASIAGSLDINGSIQVSSENNGSASLYLGGAVDLQNINIEVSADTDASSYLRINDIVDDSDINNIRVLADGNYGSAEAYLSSDGQDLSINGDINVLASGSTALASLNIDLAGGSTQFSGGDIFVVASSVDSSAFANLHGADAYGDVGMIKVNASIDSAYASLHIDTEGAHSLIVNDNINVSAYGEDASARLAFYGSIDFDGADLSVAVDGSGALASVNIDHISGATDQIYLNAADEDSLAKLRIGDAQGTLNSIYLTNINSNAINASVDVSIGSDAGHSLTIQDNITALAWALGADISVDLDAVNFDSASIYLNAANNTSFDDSSATIHLNIDDAQGTLSSISLWNSSGNGLTDVSIGSDSGHSVKIQDGISLTAVSDNDIVVLSIDNPDFDTASINLDSGVSAYTQFEAFDAQGTISSIGIQALDSASAFAFIGSDTGHSVTIQDAINLEASGQNSNVRLNLENVYYDVADVSINVSGQSAFAQFSDDAQGVIDSISMRINGEGGLADAKIYTANSESVSIVDGVTIIAGGQDAVGSLYIEDVQFDGSSLSLNGSDIYLQANGIDSSVNLSIDYAQGKLDSIRVVANNNSSNASAFINGDISLQNLSDINLTTGPFNNASALLAIDGLTIEDASNLSIFADGTDAFTNLNIDDLNINFNNNDLYVQAGGNSAVASLLLADDNETSSGLGILSGITVEALGEDASAVAVIAGSIEINGNLMVNALGQSGDAVLGIFGSADLDNVNINVSSGNEDASALLIIGEDGIVDDSDINNIVVETDGSLSIDLNGGSLYLNG
ncbi:hypothetical protein EB001_21285, partial [bacterium]|nr:hypothetical protein [bacterium]